VHVRLHIPLLAQVKARFERVLENQKGGVALFNVIADNRPLELVNECVNQMRDRIEFPTVECHCVIIYLRISNSEASSFEYFLNFLQFC